MDTAIKISVTAETWRVRLYVAFWSMCLFAYTISEFFARPQLLAGPANGMACPPYDRTWEEGGVYSGKGFDMRTQSHLQESFGFSNICTNWDYTPARELTSIVYPLFEYSFLIYLILDFCCTYLAKQRGELTDGFWTFSKIVFPINILFVSQFRQIFVALAYVNVEAHTLGFLGMQLALAMVALQNAGFIWDAGIAYEALGGLTGTRIAVVVYTIIDIIANSFKILGTFNIVFLDGTPKWYFIKSPIGGLTMGRLLDYVWMLTNALMPLLIALFRSKREIPLDIVVTQNGGYESVPGGGVELRQKYETAQGGEIM